MNTANYTRLTNNMKRELKFRAWHIEEKQMMDWSTMKQSAFNNGGINVFYEVLISRKEDYEVMQFTGLTDKNGKEIYEGDILNCRSCNYKLVRHFSGAYELHDIDSDKIFFLFLETTVVEVIGNIYENPELIN